MATIDDIDKKIQQLKNQKQVLLTKERQKERKERTHRLIQVGAIFEKYLNITTVEQAEEIAKRIAETKSY